MNRTPGALGALADLYSPVRDDLRLAEEIFDAELVGALPFVNELCDTVRSYRGKMLRPALLLLSGRAAGTLGPWHHTLAAVVEMVHMATLVHDDVLDGADQRRRQPTIASLHGNVAAVLLGDYLISHAFHLCSSLPDPRACRRIGAAANTICEGELLQNALRTDENVGEDVYLDIIRRKTASLTAAACELGAAYADASPEAVEALRTFGKSAGMAFQIVDDVLDIVGEPERVGKSLGRDLATGKLTLPTIHALQAGPPSVRGGIRAMLRGELRFDRARLRDWLASVGSLDYAAATAEGFVSEARRRIDLIAPSESRSSLLAMAEFITTRRF